MTGNMIRTGVAGLVLAGFAGTWGYLHNVSSGASDGDVTTAIVSNTGTGTTASTATPATSTSQTTTAATTAATATATRQATAVATTAARNSRGS